MLELEREDHHQGAQALEKGQKEYFLNEQMKEIQKELGRTRTTTPPGAQELEERLKDKGLPEVTRRSAKGAQAPGRLQPMSPESAVLRTYLEWIGDLPWTELYRATAGTSSRRGRSWTRTTTS